MQFLTSLAVSMSEAYLTDVEVKDMHGENETVVLCNVSASFSSELHDWLLGCRFSCIRALEPLLVRAFLLQIQHYFALPKPLFAIEGRGNVQVRIFWWYCRAAEGWILNPQLPQL